MTVSSKLVCPLFSLEKRTLFSPLPLCHHLGNFPFLERRGKKSTDLTEPLVLSFSRASPLRSSFFKSPAVDSFAYDLDELKIKPVSTFIGSRGVWLSTKKMLKFLRHGKHGSLLERVWFPELFEDFCPWLYVSPPSVHTQYPPTPKKKATTTGWFEVRHTGEAMP